MQKMYDIVVINSIKAHFVRALRWSEKYTKTDMLYLAKGGFWLTLGQVVSSISAFLLSIVFANYLPKEVYGTYRYILSILSLLAIPSLSGMNTAIMLAVAQKIDSVVIPAFVTKVRWGTIGGVMSLILSIYYFYQSNHTLSISFLIAAFFVPIMDALSVYDAVLQGKKDFRTSTRFNILSQTVSLLTLSVSAFLTNNIYIILLAYFIPVVLMRSIFLYFTIRKINTSTQKDLSAINYGKKLSAINILNVVSSQMDKVLIFHYLGAVELATYTLAMAVPDQIKNVFKNIGVLIFPKFSQKTLDDIKKIIKERLPLFMGAMIVVALSYIAIAPLVYKILFPHYLQSIMYSQVYALILILVPKVFHRIALESQRMSQRLLVFQLINFIARIVLLILLVRPYGIWGAIGVNMLSETIVFVTLVLLLSYPRKNVRQL